MSLLCNCPADAALPSIVLSECLESFGQIQKLIFQRVFTTPGVKNTIATPLLKASWTALLSATAGTKIVVSPYVENPTSEPGAARKFGGGNATLNGVEKIVGREPSSFSAMLYSNKQSWIALYKKLSCENTGVWLVDEHGRIGCLASDGVDTPTTYFPIPIFSLFIGDKKFGNLEEADSNTIEFKMAPNWSDKFVIIKPTDFDPLTELINV